VGNYKETDFPDAQDLYGRSKLLGEVADAPCITLRTSIIGREMSRKAGLLEWFLAQNGIVKGFRNAIFSGFTTHEMARIIEHVLTARPHASGVYQVSSAPISKYDLLLLIKAKLGHDIEVVPDDAFRCDRSLDSTRFQKAFDYTPPSWDTMIAELATGIEVS
jgi:dTDP-4-dehydrorhamnose reductase